MARLWSCGFELQSVTQYVENDLVVGSPTIDTTTKRSGAASMRCNFTNSYGYIGYQFTASSSAAFYARFYLYITAYPSSLSGTISSTEMTLASFGPAGDYSCYLTLSTTGTLRIRDYDDSIRIGPSSALSTGQWYRIEIKHDDTNSTVELKVDGTTVGTDTSSNLTAITSFYVGAEANNFSHGSGSCDYYIDDIAINDTSGSAQNSYPGAGSIIHMQPNAAGDAAATTGTYEAIDEVTPNDATDYIEIDTDSGGQQANYNFESWTDAGGSSGDTITLVQVGVRHRPETAASASYTPQIKSQSGGTTTSGTATTHNDTTWKTNGDTAPRNYKLTSYTDPQGGGAWTPTLLSSMIAGVNVTDGNPDLWISTIWALVEYVPSTSTNVTISPSVQTLTSSQPSPTISTVRNASITPSVQTSTFSLPSPTITAVKNITVALGIMAATFAQPDPTVSLSTNASVAVEVQTITSNLPAPTISTVRNLTYSPNAQAVTFSILNPSVATVKNITTSTDILNMTASLPIPTASGVINLTYSPNPQTATFSLNNVSVSTVRNATTLPSVLSLVASQPDPIITAVRNVSSSVSVIGVAFSQESPTISTTIDTQVLSEAHQASFALQTPTVTGIRNATVSQTTLAVTFSQTSATLSTTRNITVTQEVQTASFSILSPSITAGGSIQIGASTQATDLSIPVPVVFCVRNASILVNSQNTIISTPGISVSTGIDVETALGLQSFISSLPSPTLLAFRNIVISPEVGSTAFSVQSPSVSVEAPSIVDSVFYNDSLEEDSATLKSLSESVFYNSTMTDPASESHSIVDPVFYNHSI